MTWYGVGPSGSFATLNTGSGLLRYDWEEGRGDVSGLVDNLLVIGIYGRAISSTPPSSGNLLVFDGTVWYPTSTAIISGITPHELLSNIHNDTIAANPLAGDIVAGSGSPARWSRFPIGVPGQHLRVSESGDLVWSFDPLTIVSSGSIVNLTSNSIRVIINKISGSPTYINLPSYPFFGQEVLVKDGKGDASINNISVYPPSGLTIDGFSYILLGANYQSFHFLFNGTNWNII